VEVQQSEVGDASFRSSPFTRVKAARLRRLKKVDLSVEGLRGIKKKRRLNCLEVP
jgi:hypothetical protein